ncbi:TonB-linked SusC/RagA family outer membrane protein [Flavobacterium arsenatis]|uniref:TonB-linked SusC/RagA family outer membrane protein n=1 Tax=Flavobacterium arsenatis TaxID=1484332 RepID=A0ABU1TU48_9FLAO|nr:TonB-dependent receptor [Flavobacterium arsenatis]MDR6969404.1 TonB-linked SusC/RagA family outer membrane protein [Flavobacterium arsenatis]
MKFNFLVLNRFKFILTLFLFLSVLAVQKTQAQNTVAVSGTIVDTSDGLPLPGVNIVEKGTTNGVSSDFDGNYTINVSSSNATIVISFMGYKPQEIPLQGRTTVQVNLAQDEQSLEEVVVIGYGTSRKSDLTGAVGTLSGDEIKRQPISSVAEALTGRIAGVRVTSSEGSPDSEIIIRIRGGASLSQDASPLYIVDGFPVNNINDISPSDIENITVLKDASSTAIYGSRGANGVVLVTTKSGKNGEKVNVSFDTFTGFKKIANTVDVLNPADYAKWQYEFALLKDDLESYETFFGPYSEIGQYDNVQNTNWQREIYGRTGMVQNHNLGIRGGSEKFSYNFNYVRYDEDAIMLGSSFKRDNLSLNLKNKASDKIDLSFTVRYSKTKINGGGANEQREISSTDSRLKHVIGYSPIDIPGLVTDDTDEAVAGNLVNPFVAVADNDRLQERTNYNMLGGLNWKITDDLHFRSDLGLDSYQYDDSRFYGRSTYYVGNIPSAENQGLPALIFSKREESRFRNANTLNYDFKKILGEDHSIKLLLGEEMIISKTNMLTNVIHAFPKFFDFDTALNLTSRGTPQSVDNFNFPDDKLLSFFGRFNYDYKNRYIFTATYRADGSSKFLGNNSWGYFPSAAAAWKISEESFLKDATWIDLVKMRLSYGKVGNNNIPDGQAVQSYQSIINGWINGVPNYLAPINVMPNPDLKWETTTTQNIGLDYAFSKGRLSGSIDFYKNITDDLLLRFPVAGSGYDFQYRNMGEIQNKGIETSINYEVIRKENYGLSVSFNISFNENRINSLGVMDNFEASSTWASTAIGPDFAVYQGQPIGMMFGYQNAGRYEVSDFDFADGVYTLKEGVADASSVVGMVVPGSMKLIDRNGDGVVDGDDRTIIGNSNPKNTGGLTLNGRIHNFDFSAAFNWSYGNDVYNASKIEHTTSTVSSPNGQYRNLTTVMEDGARWTNINAAGELVTDPAELTALNANTTMWSPNMQRFVMSDWAIEDGSFLRLNTLTLGYSLPESVLKPLGISRFRLYGTMTNVFVWTNYSGLDPEVSTRRATPYTPGVDYSPYPRNRQVVFGLNLNF